MSLSLENIIHFSLMVLNMDTDTLYAIVGLLLFQIPCDRPFRPEYSYIMMGFYSVPERP